MLGTYVLELRTPGHILQILKCEERLIEAADKTQRIGFFFGPEVPPTFTCKNVLSNSLSYWAYHQPDTLM